MIQAHRDIATALSLWNTADGSFSLSSFGGEGWGEEATMPGSRSCPCLPLRLSPSPRASLAGRGRSLRWQCREAPVAPDAPTLDLRLWTLDLSE